MATTVTQKKGKAMKRKSQPLNVQSDTEWTTGDDEEPCPRLMMSNMGVLLSTLNNTRMEGFKRKQDHMEGELSPIQCTLPLQVPPPAKIRYRLPIPG